jgi:hypothetical protein
MSYTLQESKSVLMQRVSVSADLVAPSVTDGTGAIDTGKLASLMERLAYRRARRSSIGRPGRDG